MRGDINDLLQIKQREPSTAGASAEKVFISASAVPLVRSVQGDGNSVEASYETNKNAT